MRFRQKRQFQKTATVVAAGTICIVGWTVLWHVHVASIPTANSMLSMVSREARLKLRHLSPAAAGADADTELQPASRRRRTEMRSGLNTPSPQAERKPAALTFPCEGGDCGENDAALRGSQLNHEGGGARGELDGWASNRPRRRSRPTGVMGGIHELRSTVQGADGVSAKGRASITRKVEAESAEGGTDRKVPVGLRRTGTADTEMGKPPERRNGHDAARVLESAEGRQGQLHMTGNEVPEVKTAEAGGKVDEGNSDEEDEDSEAEDDDDDDNDDDAADTEEEDEEDDEVKKQQQRHQEADKHALTETGKAVGVLQPAVPLKSRVITGPPEGMTCRAHLEQVEAYPYRRSYQGEEGIRVKTNEERYNGEGCEIGCLHDAHFDRFDGVVGHVDGDKPSFVLTMESATNYPDTEVEAIHAAGRLAMTPRYDADVPTVYSGWNTFDILRPMVPTAEKRNVLAGFISNCYASSFRLDAVKMLQDSGVTVHGYGACLEDKYPHPFGPVDTKQTGRPETDDVLPYVKFGLAFENSEEPDYVTEKYFRCLQHGTVPIVIGATNIEDFMPSPDSIIRINGREDMPRVIEEVKRLMANDTAYEEMLSYKLHGPSPGFLALMDLGNAHPFCRACILLADREKAQERVKHPKDRPCACREHGTDTMVHHVYWRERGLFNFRSIYLEEPLTVGGLHDAVRASLGPDWQPSWAVKRPNYRVRDASGTWSTTPDVHIYRIYPVGVTQHEALRGNTSRPFSELHNPEADGLLSQWVQGHACGELEVIFV